MRLIRDVVCSLLRYAAAHETMPANKIIIYGISFSHSLVTCWTGHAWLSVKLNNACFSVTIRLLIWPFPLCVDCRIAAAQWILYIYWKWIIKACDFASFFNVITDWLDRCAEFQSRCDKRRWRAWRQQSPLFSHDARLRSEFVANGAGRNGPQLDATTISQRIWNQVC